MLVLRIKDGESFYIGDTRVAVWLIEDQDGAVVGVEFEVEGVHGEAEALREIIRKSGCSHAI